MPAQVAPGFISDSANRRINSVAENVVSYLLMRDEFQLESPVSGTSDFASDFENKGLKDAQGRSLRDFDLETRLFKYPCSYLIYSPAFDGLPEEVRKRIMSRLREMHGGKEYDAAWHRRMRGEGPYAEMIAQRFDLAITSVR